MVLLVDRNRTKEGLNWNEFFFLWVADYEEPSDNHHLLIRPPPLPSTAGGTVQGRDIGLQPEGVNHVVP